MGTFSGHFCGANSPGTFLGQFSGLQDADSAESHGFFGVLFCGERPPQKSWLQFHLEAAKVKSVGGTFADDNSLLLKPVSGPVVSHQSYDRYIFASFVVIAELKRGSFRTGSS